MRKPQRQRGIARSTAQTGGDRDGLAQLEPPVPLTDIGRRAQRAPGQVVVARNVSWADVLKQPAGQAPLEAVEEADGLQDRDHVVVAVGSPPDDLKTEIELRRCDGPEPAQAAHLPGSLRLGMTAASDR